MKLFLVLLLLSFNSYAETCKGIIHCGKLYTELTGKSYEYDARLNEEISMAMNEATLTKENATQEFTHFLNINAVKIKKGKNVVPMRAGDYLKAPIFLVTPNNIPQMINKDGLVTLVYEAKKPFKTLVTKKIKGWLSRPKEKSVPGIVEYDESKIISVSDTYEHAEKIIRTIVQNDVK